MRPSPAHVVLAIALVTAPPTAARAQTTPAPPHPARRAAARAAADSAFAAVQARGADRRGMGVEQSTSVHRFDALPDGGRIELQRGVDDPAGVAQVRTHLREIARAFQAGDFSTPGFVHMRAVPGTAVMAARRDVITYTVRDLPRGGAVRITTRDPEARRAVHAFLAFQRQDHRATGAGIPGQAARPMPPGHVHAERGRAAQQPPPR